MKQKKGYVWIESYTRKKKHGQRKCLIVKAHWRKQQPRKKVYIEIEDDKDV